jgi:hypothetical protein
MKKCTLIFLLLTISSYAFSQCGFTISANNPAYCGMNGGTLNVNVSGGIAPFTYQLNNGTPQVANIFYNVLAGTYTVYVTDATPCMDSVVVVSAQSPPLVININAITPTSCVPGCDGTSSLQVVGGAGGLSYTISGGAFIDMLGSASNLCAGTIYTISCTDANSCTATTTIQLTTPNAPAIYVNAVTPPSCVPGCNGSLTTITVGGNPAYTYNIGGGAYINAMGAASNLCGGMIYTMTVVDANACTGSTTVQILAPPAISLSITNITNPTCFGGCNGSAQLVTIGGVAPISYSISAPGNVMATGFASNLCAGTYTATATDGNGCSVTATFSVSQPSIIAFTNAAFTNPTCAGITDGIINVTTAGGLGIISYDISPLVGNQNPPSQFNNLPSGNYTITATDANNCSNTTAINITQPSLNFTVNTINNLSCTCNGSVAIQNIGGGVAPFSYAIVPAANQPLPGTFDNMCGGVYTITVTDANNCTGTTIMNFNQIQITYTGSNSLCNGANNATINCIALYGTAPYTFTLNPGNIVNVTGIFSNLAGGTYTISVVDAGLCNNTITVIRTNNTEINVNIINVDSVICGVNGGATFSANGNAPGPYTYTVQPGNIVNANGVFNSLNTGAYTVTVNNAAGCIKANPFDIIQISALLPVAVTSNSYDESCNLSADGAIDITPANPNGLTYQWNTGDITQDITGISSGNYSVQITDVNGDCITIYDTISESGINCGTISGNVYLDSNSSCTNDIGDYPISNVHVSLSNGAIAITNMNGDYKFLSVAYGTYTITQIQTPSYVENNCIQPSSVTVNAANGNLMNINYKDSTIPQVDALVFVSSSNIAPGFNVIYYTSVFNNSANYITGNLSFKNINNLPFNSSVPNNQGVYPLANGDSIVWNNVPIAPYSLAVFTLNYTVPANLPLGTLVTSIAKFDVTNYSDINLSNNIFVHQPAVVGAFDPNDKSVNPPGEGPTGNITLQDSLLNYQIRFQNTGTDSAHNIYILDTLSDKLDIHTLKVTGFSHPYKIEILNGNVLKFKFDNIMLPDSNVNEPLSHGYIAYSMEQKNTNQIGDVINNTAAIYFDFNAPIITNTTINTIAFPTNVTSQELDKQINVYPNPAKDKLTIEFNSTSSDQSSLTLSNTLGQVVKTVIAQTTNGKNTIELTVKELPKGVYLLKLAQGKKPEYEESSD